MVYDQLLPTQYIWTFFTPDVPTAKIPQSDIRSISETGSNLVSLLNTVGHDLLFCTSAFDEKDVIICFVQNLLQKLE